MQIDTQTTSSARDRGGFAPSERDELRDILASAGLGPGHGFDWLFDRLDTTGGAAR